MIILLGEREIRNDGVMNILNPEGLAPKLRIDNISGQVQMCAMGFIIEISDKYSGEFENLYMVCPDEECTVLEYRDAVNIFYEYISKPEFWAGRVVGE